MRTCLMLAVLTSPVVAAGCFGTGRDDDGYADSDTQRHVDRQVDQKDMSKKERDRLPR